MTDLTKFNFDCRSCVELWNIIRIRRESSTPINESTLTFCNQCARKKESEPPTLYSLKPNYLYDI